MQNQKRKLRKLRERVGRMSGIRGALSLVVQRTETRTTAQRWIIASTREHLHRGDKLKDFSLCVCSECSPTAILPKRRYLCQPPVPSAIRRKLHDHHGQRRLWRRPGWFG